MTVQHTPCPNCPNLKKGHRPGTICPKGASKVGVPTKAGLVQLTGPKDGTIEALDTAKAYMLANGVEMQTKTYAYGECSCCYYPDFENESQQVMVPLTAAENQSWFTEEYIDEEVYYTETETVWVEDEDHENGGYDEEEEVEVVEVEEVDNPDWYEGVNDYFDSGGHLRTDLFVSYSGDRNIPDDIQRVGEVAAEGFRQAGFTVEWEGDISKKIKLVA